MKWLLCLLVILCGVSAQSPGCKSTITQGGLDYLKGVGINVLTTDLNILSIPDIDGETDTPVGHIHYYLTNIVLTNLVIPDSQVVLDTANQNLNVEIQNTQAKMTMDWKYREDAWPHISDSGSADVSISQTTISVTTSISVSGGRPVLTVTACTVAINQLDVTLHGGASWLYNLFIGLFSGQIKSSTQSSLESSLPPAIEHGVNTALATLPVVEPINHFLEVDYSLVSNPTIGSNYITLDEKGEFYDIQSPTETPFPATPLPDVVSNEMVQIFISEYAANSASYVLYSAGSMAVTITDNMLPSNAPVRLNTTYFQDLIPPFYTAYPNQMFELKVAAAQVPDVTFSASGASVVGLGTIEAVMISGGQSAFTLATKILCSGTARINQFNVVGDLTLLNDTISLQSSNVGTFDVSTLQSVVDFLISYGLLPLANKYLESGFTLPNVKGLDFIDPVIAWGDQYLYVATNATYTPS